MSAFRELLQGYPALRGVEVVSGTELSPLLPGEHTLIETARDKRRWEFQAGRHCARLALQELGFSPRPILRAAGGAPAWPEQITGSIAHTGSLNDAWAGAIVSRCRDARSLGFDAERGTALKPELWPKVLCEEERARLECEPREARAKLALLAFSAKEAVYKCQAPLSNQYLGFDAVQIHWDDSPARLNSGRFHACFRRDIGDHFRLGASLPGRYCVGDRLTLTLVVLEA
jgi:4'-phosphopantetheinyl transferase EntD